MRLLVLGFGSWVWVALAGWAAAQEPGDPPTRAAHLNYLDGWVSLRAAGAEEWANAAVNYPLSTGDRLWTDRDSRAELHLGATAIHMAPWTAFNLMRLDERVAQFSIAEGTVFVHVPRMEEGEVLELDTPNGAIAVKHPGDYRVSVDPGHDATSVTVRSGRAEVTEAGRVTAILPGQMLQLVRAGEVAGILDAPAPDEWEAWCVARDRESDRLLQISEEYVPTDLEGAEELAAYGDWSVDEVYGAVWRPRHPRADWAPYCWGRWAWVGPWGWTWVDEAKWGFAPSHYGRWVKKGSGWAWVPGQRVLRPVYSPAMVGFAASHVTREGKPPAWTPLGPGEPFRPQYRASSAYVRRINLPDVKGRDEGTAITSYANRGYTVTAARESNAARAAEGRKAATPPREVVARQVVVQLALPADVIPAAPVRNPPQREERAQAGVAERPNRRDDAVQAVGLVGMGPASGSTASPGTFGGRADGPRQRAEEPAREPVTVARDDPRPEAPARTRHDPAPARQDPEPTPSRQEAAPARHQESRPEPAPAVRHEAPAVTHHQPAAAPAAAAPVHHESAPAPAAAPTHHESAPAPSRHDDSRSSSSSDRGSQSSGARKN